MRSVVLLYVLHGLLFCSSICIHYYIKSEIAADKCLLLGAYYALCTIDLLIKRCVLCTCITDIQAVRVCGLLGKVLKQPDAVTQLFVPLDAEVPLTPCIVFIGVNAEEADHLFLHVEQTRLFRVLDAKQGMAAVMAAFWIFDATYPKGAANLLCVFEHLFLNVEVTKPSCVTRRFIARHKAAFLT
ncbi:uncharacterized protein LOC142817588 [Rhipicephalus microplus]|uniref:uncharacterized protein LOC142817588 n=1 Tax=Rhipicephalus microplus TaxID=6941 RepID=UPI003F6D5D46